MLKNTKRQIFSFSIVFFNKEIRLNVKY